ncbi:hypothetical protein LCGC14_3158060, partial [marine sediment metagenome]
MPFDPLAQGLLAVPQQGGAGMMAVPQHPMFDNPAWAQMPTQYLPEVLDPFGSSLPPSVRNAPGFGGAGLASGVMGGGMMGGPGSGGDRARGAIDASFGPGQIGQMPGFGDMGFQAALQAVSPMSFLGPALSAMA